MLQPYQVNKSPMLQKKGPNPLLGTLGTIAGTAAGAAIGGPAGAAIGGSLGSQLGNVASGNQIDPGQMAMAGLTSGMSAGAKGAADAAKGLESAKSNMLEEMAKTGATEASASQIKSIQDAATKSMAADSSILNDPFGKAGSAVKSAFMADGGQVQAGQTNTNTGIDMSTLSKFEKGLMLLSPLFAMNQGGMPNNMMGGLATAMLAEGGKAKRELPKDFDFSKLTPMSEADKIARANVDQQARSKPRRGQRTATNKAKKNKGPLCSDCKTQYKACGGMTKKY